jgi:flagellum-specific peptidoglycan hydrolase FlgJ
MDKRGMTLQALLSIILSILSLILLIYGLNKILSYGCISTEKEQANAQIENINNFLSDLKAGETADFILLAPKGWQLISFKKADLGKPSEFFDKNIICICSKEKCDGIYYCREVSKPIIENGNNLEIEVGVKTIKVADLPDFYDANSTKYESYKPSNIALDKFLSNNYPSLAGLGQCIEDAGKSSGVPVSLIIAVAAHESAGGTTGLSKNDCPKGPASFSNNLFGIKKSNTDMYGCKWPTSECLTEAGKSGVEIDSSKTTCNYKCKEGTSCFNIFAQFAAYPDRCESVKAFVKKITTSRYYKESMTYTSDVTKMAEIIGEKYATDPNWANRVSTIALNVNKGIEAIA